MGQMECCQQTYHNDKDLTIKFQNLSQNQPIESAEGAMLVSARTTDRNILLTHGPSLIEGSFLKRIPELKFEVKARLEQLRTIVTDSDQYRMQNTTLVQRGLEQHGYFCFKKTGITYIGQWKNGKPNGWGKNFYLNGGYYEGSFLGGIPHGSGRFIMENGDFYEGEVKFGRANGDGYFQTQNGEYRGAFKDNLRHGHGQQTTNDLTFEGTFEYGERKYGVLKYNDGDSYEGQFNDNVYDGRGTLTTSEGVYVGNFRNGLQNGYGEFKWNDDSFYRGNYHHGQREGDGEFYNAKNSSISRGFWKRGVLDGQGEYVEGQNQCFKCIWSEGRLVGLRQ